MSHYKKRQISIVFLDPLPSAKISAFSVSRSFVRLFYNFQTLFLCISKVCTSNMLARWKIINYTVYIVSFLLFIPDYCLSVAEDKPDKTKIKAQKKRLKVLKSKISKNANDYYTHAYSSDAAQNANVHLGNSNLDAWKDKYVERYKTTANARRHKLVAKLLQDNTHVSQAMSERAEHLKERTKDIGGQMKTLANTGKFDPELYPKHLKDVKKKYRKFENKDFKLKDQADKVYYFLDANGEKKFLQKVYNEHRFLK